jgi:hypothetical protein
MTVHFKKTPTTSLMNRISQSAVDLGVKFAAAFKHEEPKLTAADRQALANAEAKRARKARRRNHEG